MDGTSENERRLEERLNATLLSRRCASFVGYFQHPMVERIDKETNRSNIGSYSFGRGIRYFLIIRSINN